MWVWVWWVQTVGSYCFRLLIDGNYWEVCVNLCVLLAASYRSRPVIDGFGCEERISCEPPLEQSLSQGEGDKAEIPLVTIPWR